VGSRRLLHVPAKYRKGRKTDEKGRSKGEESHWKLHRGFVQTPVFRSLSGPALKLLIELHSRFNGFNNGKLSLSYQDAAELLGMSKGTVFKAFKELQEKGFIQLRRPGHWYGRLAAEWVITDQSLDGKAPTQDFKLWKPPVKPARTKKQKSVPLLNTNADDGSVSVPSNVVAFGNGTRQAAVAVADGSV
jgi:biotin operon repressor